MAHLNHPRGVFVSNGEVFIADTNNNRVRKLLRNGQIVTIAGTGEQGYNGDGQLATNAQLSNPRSVVVSSSNQVYISEMRGHRIRKIDQNGIISTVAGTGIQGYNGDGQLAIPFGLFVTEDEEILFADYGNHRVRKIDQSGKMSNIAGIGRASFSNGDGQLATNAAVNRPKSVFKYKNEIYIAEYGIRKVDKNGMISTLSGAGNLNNTSVFVHNDDVYFTDYSYLLRINHTDHIHLLRKILPNGTIKTIAGCATKGFNGDDMLATQCKLDFPHDIFVDDDSQIYIADTFNHCIRKIDQDGIMRRVVGTAEHAGYSGDVPFDFSKYPHIGPRKKQLIKPFSHAYHDLIVICVEMDFNDYEPVTKKVKLKQ